MKFKLRKRLNEDTDYYELDPLVKYADFLEEKGRLVKVGNLRFDAQAMLRPFACDTRLCFPAKKAKDTKSGKGGKKNLSPRKNCSCCVVYTPRLSTRERERLESILPGIRRRFPTLGKEIERKGGFYEWDEGFDRIVMKNGGDICIFQTTDTSEFGFHACMIHVYCKERRLSASLYKPSACVMFPIFILELGDDEDSILVTTHNREVRTLGEEDDEYIEPGCLKKNPLAKRPLYIEMKETLVHMFGAEAWRRLDHALKVWSART
ncbi:hypothetical protein JW916_12105 [Candidatus Sumerlaeota bacterium]|nr:hypothetical protein [Candidatus Sumerlaeota bacterium]